MPHPPSLLWMTCLPVLLCEPLPLLFRHWLTCLHCLCLLPCLFSPILHGLLNRTPKHLITPRQSGSPDFISLLALYVTHSCSFFFFFTQSFAASFRKLMNMYIPYSVLALSLSIRLSFGGSRNKARWETSLCLSSGFKRDISRRACCHSLSSTDFIPRSGSRAPFWTEPLSKLGAPQKIRTPRKAIFHKFPKGGS